MGNAKKPGGPALNWGKKTKARGSRKKPSESLHRRGGVKRQKPKGEKTKKKEWEEKTIKKNGARIGKLS